VGGWHSTSGTNHSPGRSYAPKTPHRHAGHPHDVRLARAAGGRGAVAVTQRSAHAGNIVGYFIEWGIYGRNYKVKDVETSGSADKLDVINYAFGNVAPDERANVVCKLGDEWADYQKPWAADESVTGEEVTWPRPILGNFQQLQALKARTRTSRC
jgi:chitinase